ncbi:MAG: DNA polymerase II large subunit [archaeon]|nr:DNA polymerase II large subunit [archaeon]
MPAEEPVSSGEIRQYLSNLSAECDKCYDIATQARMLGRDVETRVEIPRAKDLASRVEKLLDDYNIGEIADDIRRLAKEFKNRELVSLKIAEEVAKRSADNIESAIDKGIRVGLAVLTEGILVAPLEGLATTKVKRNTDGSQYVDLIFAGPIRAAGGTAQAMSVLIADVVRQAIGIGKYIPTQQEIDRFIEEIPLYKQCQHLQYSPTPEEIRLIVGNCPVCIDGEGTEKLELSGFRDLPRIETNQVRGGACLVIAEGLCQKAAKINKHVSKLGIKGWEFIIEYIKGKNVSTSENDSREVKPEEKYLKDIIAGRPIFGHPSRIGAFRLRYGRARTSGLASLAYSPASMYILDDFLALGTQLKIERPGKACVVTPCDELEGPTILLRNGDLVQCNTKKDALEYRPMISEITDCGEILIPFGEFCENNHFLVPCGYTIDSLPTDWKHPTWARALEMSTSMRVPLHPDFNLYWSDISLDRLSLLRGSILEEGQFNDNKLFLPNSNTVQKRILEDLGVLHIIKNGCIVIEKYAAPLLAGLGLSNNNQKIIEKAKFSGKGPLDAVSKAMGIEVRARAGVRIGTRMGRPEKAKDRKSNSVVQHGLFAVSEATPFKKELNRAIKQSRNFNMTRNETYREKNLVLLNKNGSVLLQAGARKCPKCGQETYRTWCRNCNTHTETIVSGGKPVIKMMPVDLFKERSEAIALLKLGDLSREVKLADKYPSKLKVPEALEKAILRCKHDVTVYKDGTIRFDMTDIPLTHFRPKEIGLSVEKARDLGYVHDWNGQPLVSDTQLCELKIHDIIPNINCGKHLVKVANFVDELLVRFYNMESYYNVQNESDIIGQLGIGLAPHTSGGILCRIIGYTNVSGCYGHPFFHAGKRRNCDGDEDCVILLLDGLLNFSRAYIPDRRGGLMDTPLVLTTRIDPNEIDKEAHNIDCLREYPLELYKAAQQLMDAKEIEKSMDLVSGRIGTNLQYEKIGFTHDTNDIAEGPTQSAYTTLSTMEDKMMAQLDLGRKIRAVDAKDVALRVINQHFMPDMIGNLRTFSTQSVRCVKCGEKYRRIPLNGKCHCGNNLTLTVHEANARKYLEISKKICEEFQLPRYVKERIEILAISMNSLFNSDKIKKCKLTDFL